VTQRENSHTDLTTDEEKPVNLFEALGVTAREDVISNMLAYCYNASAVFRRSFLRALDVTPDSPPGVAYTRVLSGDAGVPDIVLAESVGTSRAVIIIEHKLGAGEGDDQTVRYSSPECLAQLAARLSLNAEALPHYRFLTLFPDESPKSAAFISVSHQALLQQEWPFPMEDTSWVPVFTRSWLDVLARFYEAGRLELDQNLLNRLRQKDPLEGSFLAFRSFMQAIPRPSGLDYFGSWRSSQAGRRYYLAQFGKREWQPGEMDRSGPTWRLDPATCFNIHVEPQFNVFTGALSVFLHYEMNPYLPKKEARSRLQPDDYRAYETRRGQFVSAFRCPDGIAPGRGWNQFAKAAISLEQLSVEEASRRMHDLLVTISESVDRALRQLPIHEHRGLHD
jgi:hypothetical protein